MEDGIRKSRILKRRAPYLPTAVPRQALAVRAVRAQTRPAAVRSAVHSRHTESPACPALYRLWTTGLLWKTGLLEAITPCGDERAFHINHPLSIGVLSAPVGEVGNWAIIVALLGWFSKSAELHSLDLKNWPASQLLAL